MYQFEQTAPLDMTMYPDPGLEDRSGPPLSQGFVLNLIDTVASEYCTEEMQDKLAEVEPTAWYHGQTLETILNHFESQSPKLVRDIGKNIYYTLQAQFMEMGINSSEDVVTTLPNIWPYLTRGDSGHWNVRSIEGKHAFIELVQPFNCLFEDGAFQGAMECFDAHNVAIEHTQCMRQGAECCVLDVTWE